MVKFGMATVAALLASASLTGVVNAGDSKEQSRIWTPDNNNAAQKVNFKYYTKMDSKGQIFAYFTI